MPEASLKSLGMAFIDPFDRRDDVAWDALRLTRAEAQSEPRVGFESYSLDGEQAPDEHIRDLLGAAYNYSAAELLLLVAKLTERIGSVIDSALSLGPQGNLFFTEKRAVVVTFRPSFWWWNRYSWTFVEQPPDPNRVRPVGIYVFRPPRAHQ